jgi:O-antigen/teichoic acid export membrane protein
MRQILIHKKVKDTLWFSSGTYFPKLFKVVFDLLTRKIISPEIYGLNTFRMVMVSYFDLPFQLIREALGREVPLLRGAGKKNEIAMFVNASYTLTALNLVMALVIYGALFFVYFNLFYFRIAVIFGFLTTVLITISGFIQRLNMVDNNFAVVGKAFLVSGLIAPPLILLASYYWGLFGFFTASLIEVLIFSVVILIGGIKYKYKFFWNKQITITILQIGSPLIIYAFLSTTLYNLDKIFIQSFMGLGALGLYSIGAALFNTLIMVAAPLYAVQYPDLLEQMGNEHVPLSVVREKIQRTTVMVKVLIQWLSAMVIIAFPIVAYFILPKYASAILSAQILMIALYFNSIYAMYSYFLIGKKMFKELIGATLGTLIIALALYLLLYYYGLISLTWVSLVVLVWSIVLAYQIKLLGMRSISPASVYKDILVFASEDLIFVSPCLILIGLALLGIGNIHFYFLLSFVVLLVMELLILLYMFRRHPEVICWIKTIVKG